MFENCEIDFPKKTLVYCRFWEDECIVYNQLTGETHLIAGVGAVVFKTVSEKPSTQAGILHSVEKIFDLQSDFDIKGLVDSLILEYQKLGLLDVMENSQA